MSRKFGWHSGTVTAQDGKFKGDLYVQDDIVFSDVSAGVLGVTGGIDMTGTTSAIGINLTGGTFATGAIMCGTATGSRQTMAAAEDFVIGIYTTCADTDGANTAKPLYVNATYTGAGQVARAAEFVLTPTAQLGGWANAVKAYTDFATTAQAGGAAGLISSLCAEMRLPNGACTGHFFPIEVEWVGQASTSFSTVGTGAGSGFLWLKANGTVTDFDSDGVFMSVQGLTAGSGKLLATDSHTLRCDLGYGTLKYLLLSDAADSISFAYTASIAEVIAITVTTGDTVTTGMSFSGAGTYTSGIVLDATAITTGITLSAGSMADAILISGTTPVDGIHISSDCSANGILIAGACADGIEISGVCTGIALNVSGTQTTTFFDATVSYTGSSKIDGIDFNWTTATTYGSGGDRWGGNGNMEAFLTIGDQAAASVVSGAGSHLGQYINISYTATAANANDLVGGIYVACSYGATETIGKMSGITSHIRNPDQDVSGASEECTAMRALIYTGASGETQHQIGLLVGILDSTTTKGNAQDVKGIHVQLNVTDNSAGGNQWGVIVDNVGSVVNDAAFRMQGSGGHTNGIAFWDTVTNAFDFEDNDGTNGAKVVQATMDGDVADALVRIDIAGTAYYIPAFNAAGITGEF